MVDGGEGGAEGDEWSHQGFRSRCQALIRELLCMDAGCVAVITRDWTLAGRATPPSALIGQTVCKLSGSPIPLRPPAQEIARMLRDAASLRSQCQDINYDFLSAHRPSIIRKGLFCEARGPAFEKIMENLPLLFPSESRSQTGNEVICGPASHFSSSGE